VLVLVGFAGPSVSEPAPQERKPAIVLAPPPGDAVEPEAEPAVEAEVPDRQPPPIARKKPTPPPKKASAPKRAADKPAAKKAPANKAPPKKAPAKKAPAKKAAASPAPPAKDCDYCYGCESLSQTCKRKWVCGRQYTERLAAGLCRR
jgi:hypothetical protein